MESIFNALESDGSEWAIKQLELLKKMVFIETFYFMNFLHKEVYLGFLLLKYLFVTEINTKCNYFINIINQLISS